MSDTQRDYETEAKEIRSMSEQRDWDADRRLCDVATPGPWQILVAPMTGYNYVYPTPFDSGPRIANFGNMSKSADNAQFTLEARMGWPAALDENARLRRLLAEAAIAFEALLGAEKQHLSELERQVRMMRDEIGTALERKVNK